MRKWIIIIAFAISFLVIVRLVSAEWSTTIKATFFPSTIYVDGKQMKTSNREGYYYNGASYVPATIEYQGTLYVPLKMVGEQMNKDFGWNKETQTVWLGKQPASPQTANVAAVPANSTAMPTNSTAVPVLSANESGTTQQQPTLFGVSLGITDKEVLATLGNPSRRDPGSLGYDWWIYNQNPNRYLQIGILNGKVVDLYSNAPTAKVGNVSIGTTYQSLSGKHQLKNIVSFHYQNADVQITNQVKEKPLALSGDTPLMFYLDKQNDNKVTAIRVIDKLALLRGGFYETKWSYQGKAPDFDPPALTIKQLELVNAAAERQTLDLVNVIRYRYKLAQLTWHHPASQVARSHSMDMENNNFFQHVSASTGLDPFQRLQKAGVTYQMAGENIAAGFPDAIEAHENWMNSPGHRKNILEKSFTGLGVGVYAAYYTEEFITAKK